MKPFIHILLASGMLYEVPTQLVADDRAKVMLEMHKDEFADLAASMADTVELFDDDLQVADWAKNNMDVAELLKQGRLVRFTPPEQDLLNDTVWTLHDAAALVPQIDATTVLQTPLEVTIAAMAAHRNVCQLTVLNDDTGKAAAAVVIIQGGEAVVGAYVGALTHMTNTFLQPDPAANQH